MNKIFAFFFSVALASCSTDPFVTSQNALEQDQVHTRTSPANASLSAVITAFYPDGHSETLSATHVSMTFESAETMTVVVDHSTTLVCTRVEVYDTDSELCIVTPNVCAQNHVKVRASTNQLHYTINPTGLTGQSPIFVVEETDGL